MTGSSSAQPRPPGGKGLTATATQTETNPWQREAGPHTATEMASREDGRIEPTLDASRLPPDPNYFAKLADDADAYRRTPGRRLRWLGVMLGVFAIGAGAGLGGAWWLHSSEDGFGEPDISQSSAQPLQQPSSSGRSTPMRGIRPSELPYDGAAPPPADRERPEAPATIAKDEPSITQSSGSSLPEPDQATATTQSGPQVTQVQPAPPAPPAQSVTTEQKAQDADAERAARVVRKSSSGSVAGATPRRKNVARPGDREIERIRRQVDEELKKKTERRQGIAGEVAKRRDADGRRPVVTTVTRSGASITPALVAQCAKAPNFIQREICKWRVCNGKWGTHGCPSYQAHAANY